MTDKPAAMVGVYVDMRFMPGLKMARISIEIPIEHSNEFIRMFGTPDRTDPVHVAIARLQTNSGLDGESRPDRTAASASTVSGASNLTHASNGQAPAAPVVKAETKKSRSQIAAIKLSDPEFCTWLRERNRRTWEGLVQNDDGDPDDLLLKHLLGIASKRELDSNPEKAQAFDKMIASYDYRNQVRA